MKEKECNAQRMVYMTLVRVAISRPFQVMGICVIIPSPPLPTLLLKLPPPRRRRPRMIAEQQRRRRPRRSKPNTRSIHGVNVQPIRVNNPRRAPRCAIDRRLLVARDANRRRTRAFPLGDVIQVGRAEHEGRAEDELCSRG